MSRIVKKIAQLKIIFCIRKLFKRIHISHERRKLKVKHKKAIERVRNKEKIKVAFLLIHQAVWKYETIYKLMSKNSRFEPTVFVCPYTSYGVDTMMQEMNQAYDSFKKKGYNVFKTYDETTGNWFDIKSEHKPDIVFFTNPHKLTKEDYYIYNFLDTLTCYVQYSFHITHLNEEQYNQQFHNFIWKLFYETKIHYGLARKYSFNNAKNVIVTGFPGIDKFLDSNYKPKDIWKKIELNSIRIIWAPHHTIFENDADLGYSTFLRYHEFMFELIEKFNNKIQIAFKPHPILKSKLYQHHQWGKNRTDNYYNRWRNHLYGQLEEGDYIDLFLTCDSMIFDSASFMTEFLYLNKPSIFTVRNAKIIDRFNDFGKIVFQNHYHAHNEEEIKYFIREVIFNKGDNLNGVRGKFVEEYLIPPNHKTASENILEYLENELKI